MASFLTRLHAIWIDDPMRCTFMCDIMLDEATQMIVGGWDIMGVIDHGRPQQRPFVWDRHGRIDFGQDAPARLRYWHASLRGQPLHIGVQFDIDWPDDDRGRFRIEKLASLGSKQADMRDDD
jgi:hypothetical protein